MSRVINRKCLPALLLAVLLTGSAAYAQDTPGILVVGMGEVKAKPSVVQIGATVSGEADVAGDAAVKYRDAKSHAIAALQALKLDALSIESCGFSINQPIDQNQAMMMMQGRAATPGKQKVEVTEQLRLTLKDADKLTPDALIDLIFKVVDAARDAGLTIGPPAPTNYYMMQMQAQSGQGQGMITFTAPDPSTLRDQAYKLALDDARAKAQRLATMAGVTLGSVISVREDLATANVNSQAAMMMQMYGVTGPSAPGGLSSSTFDDIPVRVALTVQFEIRK